MKKRAVVGATGFIGKNLVHALSHLPEGVKGAARRVPSSSAEPKIEFEAIDLLKTTSISKFIADTSVVYYLVHALGGGGPKEEFEEVEARQAQNFIQAILDLPTGRRPEKVIYLGGISPKGNLSPHLQSRKKVGEILATGPIPCLEIQASIVIGEGSLSFELIRALVERLPVLPKTKWSETLAQPISLSDLILILVNAPNRDEFFKERHFVLPVGGPDQVSYFGLLQAYAKLQNLNRPTLEIPMLSKKIAGAALTWIAPEYATVGKKLLESADIATVLEWADSNRIVEKFGIDPMSLEKAMERAIESSRVDHYGKLNWKKIFLQSRDTLELRRALQGARIVDTFALPLSPKMRILSSDQIFHKQLKIPGVGNVYLRAEIQPDSPLVARLSWVVEPKRFWTAAGISLALSARDQIVALIGRQSIEAFFRPNG